MAYKTKLKTIFHQGQMIIGETTKKSNRFLMFSPLLIFPIENNRFTFVPFGMGMFKSPISFPDDVIISDPSKYGVREYYKAVKEINKKIEIMKKEQEPTIQ